MSQQRNPGETTPRDVRDNGQEGESRTVSEMDFHFLFETTGKKSERTRPQSRRVAKAVTGRHQPLLGAARWVGGSCSAQHRLEMRLRESGVKSLNTWLTDT